MMPNHIPPDRTASLVRDALESDATQVDIVRLQSQIREKVSAQGPASSVRRRASTRYAAMLGHSKRALIAATVLVAAGLAIYFSISPEPAQAYALLRSARAVLTENADREYEITFEGRGGLPLLKSIERVRLWTRGDRYRVEFARGDRRLLWGKDDQQRVWIVASADKGLSFDSAELPREVATVLSYLSLDLKHLTDQILHECELSFSEGMQHQRSGVKTVIAEPKRGDGTVEFVAAQIDIDESTKAIRRFELTRHVNGAEKGRCNFVLTNESPQSDASYRLDAYLNTEATVLDKAKYDDRMVELFQIIRDFRSQ